MATPTRETILAAMEEFRQLGETAFYAKYGHEAISTYVRHEGVEYPTKALWFAAHSPGSPDFNPKTDRIVRELRTLGFVDIIKRGRSAASAAEISATEGRRYIVEMERIVRSSALAQAAKEEAGYACEVCFFEYPSKYGELGQHYIECHHINPVSERDGEGEITKLDELAVLCADCHRMIHRKTPCLTIMELREIFENNRSGRKRLPI